MNLIDREENTVAPRQGNRKNLKPLEFIRVARVLIYRLGSLGDTIVALPCFHLVARRFPNAERRLLTNVPASYRAPVPASVLGECDLIHSYMYYPLGLRDPRRIIQLRTTIRMYRPELLVYLTEPRGFKTLVRDSLFFRACGIQHIVGIPWRRSNRVHRFLPKMNIYESESERLARSLSALGNGLIGDPRSWDLRLNSSERAKANELLSDCPWRGNFVACCIGTKFEVNDWGADKWRELIAKVLSKSSGLGLLMLGSAGDRAGSDRVASDFRGRVRNLCGLTTPRESAALLEKASIFVGHDSGPMHLAAAVGTPCVAVFSARNLPGPWFPNGNIHRVIYHSVPCAGCGLDRCSQFNKTCITSIGVNEVYEAVIRVIDPKV